LIAVLPGVVVALYTGAGGGRVLRTIGRGRKITGRLEGLHMADAAQLRRLVDYNQWANERILKAIEGMTAGELARPVDAYFGSLDTNPAHVVRARRIWLARWKRGSPPAQTDPIAGPWPDAYAATHAEFREFVGALTDATADRIVDYQDSRGVLFR